MDEETAQLIESAANMLRGMMMDPAIPKHAKDAMFSRVQELEDAVADYIGPDEL